jgi:hypothetical protein
MQQQQQQHEEAEQQQQGQQQKREKEQKQLQEQQDHKEEEKKEDQQHPLQPARSASPAAAATAACAAAQAAEVVESARALLAQRLDLSLLFQDCPFELPPSAPLEHAHELMRSIGVHGVLVTQRRGTRLAGVVTRRELLMCSEGKKDGCD